MQLGAGKVVSVRTQTLSSRGAVHYTPNRWLVLTLTVIVAARIFYGSWRLWAA